MPSSCPVAQAVNLHYLNPSSLKRYQRKYSLVGSGLGV
jgi:hypothetical protein